MFWGSMSIGTTSGLKNLNNLAGGLASSAVSWGCGLLENDLGWTGYK